MGVRWIDGQGVLQGGIFHLLHPVWFKKFILCIVRPLVTWVQTLKMIRAWTNPYRNLSLAETPPFNYKFENLEQLYIWFVYLY